MKSLARWLFASLLGSVACAILLGGGSCGGNVVVDSGATSGSSGVGGGGAAATGAGAGGSTATGAGGDSVQFPDGGSFMCQQDYYGLVAGLQNALQCTSTAVGLVQCSGSALLQDPCGCFHVANEAHPDNIGIEDMAYQECVADGCCGPQATIGCSACPPAPTTGHCDSFTSVCVPGP